MIEKSSETIVSNKASENEEILEIDAGVYPEVMAVSTYASPTTLPKSTTKEIAASSAAKEATVADPIGAYDGAHKIQNTIMKLFGGMNLSLTAHYDSNRLMAGSMGAGWYHNYEKHLDVFECEALLYESPSSYCKFVCSEGDMAWSAISPGKKGYILSINYDNAYPYCVNCNSKWWEFYDIGGNLVKIQDK